MDKVMVSSELSLSSHIKYHHPLRIGIISKHLPSLFPIIHVDETLLNLDLIHPIVNEVCHSLQIMRTVCANIEGTS